MAKPLDSATWAGVIDAGFAATFAEGRRIEAEASRAHARAVTADAIAERRRAVQERGRSQSRQP